MPMRVVFTGGGTAGHVNPNLAVIEVLRAQAIEVSYVGSYDGVERAMVEAQGIDYFAVRSGKLRRYFSWKNFTDPLNLLWGIGQSYWILRRLRPNVLFSKGGFVALPVVIAAWLNRIPVIAHESDLTPGLANRLSLPFVNVLCMTFDKGAIGGSKIKLTGTPIRRQLLQGVAERGLAYCGFDASLPCLLVMGGSQGARCLNDCVRMALPELTQHYQVIHLCGRGHVDVTLNATSHYRQFEYVDAELADLLAASHLVLSRAGANAVCEILACAKPHVLVPLSRRFSRGDQIENARYFEQKGVSVVLDEEALTPSRLLAALHQVEHDYALIKAKLAEINVTSADERVATVILAHARA